MPGSSFGCSGSGGRFEESTSSAFSSSGSSGFFGESYYNHHYRHTNDRLYPPVINEDQAAPLIVSSHRRRRGSSKCCFALAASIATILGSLWMVFGLYGSEHLEMGLNYSRLLTANRFFIQEISVRSSAQNQEVFQVLHDDETSGPNLYWFHETPSLDDERERKLEFNIDIPPFYHKEWAFWLNKGSELKLQYDVPSVSDLFIVIARGKENYERWIEDPGNPDSCLVWKAIHGNGEVKFKTESNGDDYYVGIGNLRNINVQIALKMRIKARVYSTDQADFRCPLGITPCTIVLPMKRNEMGLLTTPEKAQQGIDVWSVTVSYNTRWSTYIVIYGLLGLIILSVFASQLYFKRRTKFPSENAPSIFPTRLSSYAQRDPSTDGLYYASKPRNNASERTKEETPEENLCTICCEEPKSSFFQPCGHCATCYNCGMRIQETSKECPICRKPIQGIGKIYIT